MTVTGGGDKSLTTVTRSDLRARASTLHQLTGWLVSSETDTARRVESRLSSWLLILHEVAPSLRGVLMSSQQGPLIFLLRRKCSRKEVLVPKMCENVAPFRSEGSVGNSAWKNRIFTTQTGRLSGDNPQISATFTVQPHRTLTEYLISRYSH